MPDRATPDSATQRRFSPSTVFDTLSDKASASDRRRAIKHFADSAQKARSKPDLKHRFRGAGQPA